MSPKSSAPAGYAALLRAVNLAGHNVVSMAALREVATDLGLRDARTLLQSGNLVFREAEARRPAELEQLLEEALVRSLGVRTEVLVRSGSDLAAVISGNPFPAEAKNDPAHLVVAFLRQAASPSQVSALQAAIVGREMVRGGAGRELYLVYPEGIGRSRLTNAVIAKHVPTKGTARNWNTVLKLAAMLDAM